MARDRDRHELRVGLDHHRRVRAYLWHTRVVVAAKGLADALNLPQKKVALHSFCLPSAEDVTLASAPRPTGGLTNLRDLNAVLVFGKARASVLVLVFALLGSRVLS